MSGLRRALENRRAELATKTARRLIDAPDADVCREVARLKSVEAVLGALPVPWRQRLFWPAAAALGCLAAVWFGWAFTIDALGFRTGIVLSVESATAELQVASDWESRDRIRLADGQLRIDRAELTFSNPNRAFATLPEGAWLDVEAASATLQKLTFDSGTEVTLERADGETLAIYVVSGGATGSMLVNGSVTLTWGESDDDARRTESFSIDVPERVTFGVTRPQGAPTRILFQPAGPLKLRDLAVSGLRFGHEVTEIPGEPIFVSTVRGGRLQVPDAEEVYDLANGYSLILTDLEGHIQELRVNGTDGIGLDLSGTVDQVRFGPRGHPRDVTPSILSYLYHNQRLGFLFVAASFLWGALWSLRRLLDA